MKKILSLILILLIVLPVFASCSKDAAVSADTSAAAPSEDSTAETTTPVTKPQTEPETEPETTPETTSAPVTEPETEPAVKETEKVSMPAVVTSLKLNASVFELDVGYSVLLKAGITPADAIDKSVTWTSSDTNAATVDNTGKVTAKSEGKTTITAKSANGISAECVITVNKQIIAVKQINLGQSTLKLAAGQVFSFAPSVTPGNAGDTRIALVSSNKAVAVVSGFKVTAVGAGSATITATANDGYGAKAVCTVTVTAAEIPVTAKPAETKAAETEAPEAVYDEDSDLSLPVTNKPYLSAQSIIRNGVICISGSCEEGSEITVVGSIVKEFTVLPQEKRFFFTVSLKTGQSDTLTVTAKMNGKRTSEKTEMDVTYGKGNVDVVVGKLSQLHYPMTLNDYYGNNLFNDSELEAINKLVDRRLAKVREKSGVDTKLIYLVAPNALTMYPETARDEWTAKKKTTDSRRQQFIRLMQERNDPDTIVIDVADFMTENKDKGKLYYQTDTHWNTLGAYFGYYKLMQAIAVDYPQAAPYELDQFDVKAISQEGGDLVRFLGIKTALGSETTYSCTLKAASLAKVVSEDGVLPSTALITSTVNNTKLPTAVVMRDSFGYSLQKFLFEHFEKLTYTPQSCGLDTAMTYLADAKPDYFIHVVIERYIDQLLGG